jgi:VanZ family protein
MRSSILSKRSPGSGPSSSSSETKGIPTYSDTHVRRWAIVTAIAVVFIVYGSLYPFEFRWDTNGPGPLLTLIRGWNARPGRGDFLANILLYFPLGFFFTLAIRKQAGASPTAALVFLTAAGLSITMEMLQYFDPGRVTAASDVYSNVLGVSIGIPLALFFRGQFSQQSAHATFHPAPLLLLGAWVTDRLYPFIPVIDLHKYWNALKPVVFPAPVSTLDVLRHTAIWWTVALLIEKTGAEKRSAVRFAAFAGILLIGQIFIIDGALSKAELMGLAIATTGAILLAYPARLRIGFLCLFGYVLLERLEPMRLRPVPAHFGWIPFRGFMEGSLTVNSLSFLEKSFLYGSLVWLLQELGATRLRATVIIGALVATTSFGEIYISDHSPQVTDLLLVVLIGCLVPSSERSPKSSWPRL